MHWRFMSGLLVVFAVAWLGCSGDEEAVSEDTRPTIVFDGFPTGGGTDAGSTGEPEPDVEEGGTPDGVVVPVCCAVAADCPDPTQLCLFGEQGDQGECLPAADAAQGTCWTDEDCPAGVPCEAAEVCGCVECGFVSTIGTCKSTVVAPGLCCAADGECNPGEVCLILDGQGSCNKVPVHVGGCWSDDECGDFQVCDGANPCHCGDVCTGNHKGGVCKSTLAADCFSDAECGPGFSCFAAGECTGECPPGDPACCNANVCVPEVNECLADDECDTGLCLAGHLCQDWCLPGDPACCYGNVCWTDPCAEASPAGCHHTGCPVGQGCAVDKQTCVPTACWCTEVGWECTNDCVGGACKATSCPGKNPQGCMQLGCPTGQVCKLLSKCAPTTCSCDEPSAAWACTSDCNGGECVPL